MSVPTLFLGKTTIEEDTLNIPTRKYLPNTTITAPYVIVGDETFPLKAYLMRPYPGCQSTGDDDKNNFNYRLSLARRLVENFFGILIQRYKFLTEELKWHQKNVDYTILSACTHIKMYTLI